MGREKPWSSIRPLDSAISSNAGLTPSTFCMAGVFPDLYILRLYGQSLRKIIAAIVLYRHTINKLTTGADVETVAIVDFETTGLSPETGDRATEIAIVLLREGRIIDRYQSLMNAGRRIPPDVVSLTGITDEMISTAPTAAKVMREAALFVGKSPIIAHNASFDRRFWKSELERLSLHASHPFACTMLVSRRIYPHAENHRLATLAGLLRLPETGRAHRAMADAELASHLWIRLINDISRAYYIERVGFDLLSRVQCTSRTRVPALLRDFSDRA